MTGWFPGMMNADKGGDGVKTRRRCQEQFPEGISARMMKKWFPTPFSLPVSDTVYSLGKGSRPHSA